MMINKQLTTQYRYAFGENYFGLHVGVLSGYPVLALNSFPGVQMADMYTSFSPNPPSNDVFSVPHQCPVTATATATIKTLFSLEEALEAVRNHDANIAGYSLSMSALLASNAFRSLNTIPQVAIEPTINPGRRNDAPATAAASTAAAATSSLRSSASSEGLLLTTAVTTDDYNLVLPKAPASVDNRAFATPVRNQGNCGACWSFSTMGSIEINLKYANISLPAASTNEWLSMQFLIDCAGPDFPWTVIQLKGCFGGWPSTAMQYIYEHGLMIESDYTFAGTNQISCPNRNGTGIVNGKPFLPLVAPPVVIPAGRVEQIMQAVSSFGSAVAVILELNDFLAYSGGIYNNPSCGPGLSHAVTIVGYNTDPVSGLDYWIVKNSFGREWGIGGYFYMRKGVDMCGIENNVALPLVTLTPQVHPTSQTTSTSSTTAPPTPPTPLSSGSIVAIVICSFIGATAFFFLGYFAAARRLPSSCCSSLNPADDKTNLLSVAVAAAASSSSSQKTNQQPLSFGTRPSI